MAKQCIVLCKTLNCYHFVTPNSKPIMSREDNISISEYLEPPDLHIQLITPASITNRRSAPSVCPECVISGFSISIHANRPAQLQLLQFKFSHRQEHLDALDA